ncbi:MAG: c-type cytochrome biogenesis protein CcmI [Methylococcaceae bacterium]|jgi:cytochrome c-type biogenesis protein CcmH
MPFWIIVSVMMVIALAIILPPLWRSRTINGGDQDQRNILLAKHRLAELKEQLQAGMLNQQQYDEQELELEANLAHDLDIKPDVVVNAKQGRWIVYIIAIMLPLSVLALYSGLGDYPALSINQADMNKEELELAEINRMVEGLAQHLQTQPDDAQGWLMLGRSYKYLKRYPQAVRALTRAYELLPGQAEVALLYADVLASSQDGNLAGKPTELIFKALSIEPQNPQALWVAGLAKVQAGELAAAAQLWQQLLTLLPAGSEAQQEVKDILAKMALKNPELKINIEASNETTANTVSVNPVQAEITLANDLQSAARPDDTVFIYAQALSGPQMPLAILRKQVSNLPLTVTLDDSLAMLPNMKLSGFKQVRLIARVSKSGNASQQPGDLIGIIEPIVVGSPTRHKIVIDHMVK